MPGESCGAIPRRASSRNRSAAPRGATSSRSAPIRGAVRCAGSSATSRRMRFAGPLSALVTIATGGVKSRSALAARGRDTSASESPRGEAPRMRNVSLSRGLEQLDRIAVRVFDLNLASARTGFHLVAEAEAAALERGDAAWKVRDFQDDAVPPAGLLTLTVWHRPCT